MVLSLILSFILFTLGILHMYWVFNGKWGLNNVLPTNGKGETILHPKKLDTAIVALGLLTFGLFYLMTSNLIAIDLPHWITDYLGWIIPFIFVLRAIGEFKYVGFFKRVRYTKFGKMDSLFFSPLCLTIGFLGILIKITN
ncbi:MAG: DUF3995 domain-containing protein [Saonia sp.]